MYFIAVMNSYVAMNEMVIYTADSNAQQVFPDTARRFPLAEAIYKSS